MDSNKPYNKEMIEHIYLSCYNMMYATASLYVFDKNAVKEIIHDVMVKLIERADFAEGLSQGALKAYISVCVKRRCFNYVRRKGVERKYKSFLKQISDEEDVEDKVITEQEVLRMLDALKSMPEKARELLTDKYFYGICDDEIAGKLKIKPQSVRQALTRSRRMLKERLAGNNF